MDKISPKVMDLDEYRKRKERYRYPVGECEMIIPGDDPPEGSMGTWTHHAPYGVETDEEGSSDR